MDYLDADRSCQPAAVVGTVMSTRSDAMSRHGSAVLDFITPAGGLTWEAEHSHTLL